MRAGDSTADGTAVFSVLRPALALRYIAACLALGGIATWGSEMLFWSAPRGPIDALDMTLTVLAYSLAAAAALSAVLLTRARGFAAAFLGGCILGWLVEGVVVATTYDSFPFQLVWTPMAWHGLVTGLALVGLWRWSVLKPARMVWSLAGLAAFGTIWSLYWPLERTDLPGLPEVSLYLIGLGLTVPVGHIVLDRVGGLEATPRWLLAIAPIFATIVWLVQFGMSLDFRRLALLPLIALAVLGLQGAKSHGTALQPAPHWALHLWLLLVPAAVAFGATTLWPLIGGVSVEVPLALVTSASAVAIFAWLVTGAIARLARARRTGAQAGRSSDRLT